MNIIQCYIQGAKHKRLGAPCQDRTRSLTENGVTVIALADGAGHKKYTHSGEGAECICETIVSFFCNNFDKFYEQEDVDELKNVLKTVCHRALQKKAEELGLSDIIRLSSTMLVCAVKDERVIVCHIGDGAIGKLDPDGPKVISCPDNGEFVSSTYFITNPFAEKRIDIHRFPLGDTIAFYMMSDGVSEYVYDDKQGTMREIAQKLAALAAQPNGEQMLNRVITDYIINKHQNSDDCSYIILSFAPMEEAKMKYEAIEESDESDKGEDDFSTLRSIEEVQANAERQKKLMSIPNNDMLNQTVDIDKSFNEIEEESEKETARLAVIISLILVMVIGISVIAATLILKHNNKKVFEENINSSTAESHEGNIADSDSTIAETSDKLKYRAPEPFDNPGIQNNNIYPQTDNGNTVQGYNEEKKDSNNEPDNEDNKKTDENNTTSSSTNDN